MRRKSGPRFVESESVVANAVLTGAGRGWLKAERAGSVTERVFFQFMGVAGRARVRLFATSTLVHYTLRETQARMLRFTAELRETISSRRSYARLVNAALIRFAALPMWWVCWPSSSSSSRTRSSGLLF